MQTYVENQPVISRWMAAVPLAVMITLFLLVVMEKLVFIDMEAPDDAPRLTIIDPVYKDVPLVTHQTIKKVEKEDVVEPPAIPDLGEEELPEGGVNIAFTPTSQDFGPGVNIGFSGVPIAQYLTTPKYPNRAVQRGIEGYVDVRFDISVIGVTQNISVTGASPEGVFEKSALAAVKRWRYQPKMEDGVAQRYEGMTHRIVFNMED